MSPGLERGILIPIGSSFDIRHSFFMTTVLPSPYDTETSIIVNSWIPNTLEVAGLTGLSGTWTRYIYAVQQFGLYWVNASGFNFYLESQMVLVHGLYSAALSGFMDYDSSNALNIYLEIWGGTPRQILLCSYNPTTGWVSAGGTVSVNTFHAGSPGVVAKWTADLSFDTVSLAGDVDCTLTVASFNNISQLFYPFQGFQFSGGFVSYP